DKNTGDVNEDTSAVGDANEDASAGNDAAASAEDKAAGNEGGVEHATGDESAVAASAEDSTSTSQSERSKTFVYTITEVAGKGLPGVTNDSTTKTVTVTVTDNGDGTLSVAKIADKSADKGMDFTFTNTYSTTPAESSPTGDGGLTFTKVWDRQSGARNLAAGDFTFKMEDAQGTEYTATNDANGNVEMPAITFSEAGDYTYTLSEVVPDGAKPVADGYELNGVTYHAATYTVTAHVVDNHSGTLEVTWNMVDGQGKDTQTATFTNTYNVQPTTITFGASKALEGRSVAADEFSFALKDADGNVLGTATNDAKGQVVFTDARQTFSEAGTYTYTVSEVLPQDDDPATEGIQKDGVTYDETVYTAQVTLVDGNNGQLTIEELTYNDVAELPTFVNSYNEGQEGGVEPSGGEGDSEGGHFLEKTGDNPWLIGLLVALIAAAAGTAGYAGRKTWKKNAAANHAAAHLGKHGRL
ncbi:MAG: FctA domain-containing protein, partial [Eggerthellaceae bacterium]